MKGGYRKATREWFSRRCVHEAWIDHSKTKIGYEIPFTRHFYECVPPRPLAEIDAELLETEKRIQELLGEMKS